MYPIRVRPNSEPEQSRPETAVNSQRKITSCDCCYYDQETAVNSEPKSKRARYEPDQEIKYIFFDERLKSFKNWPVEKKQKPFELADAGFYYSGEDDRVICFSCNGSLLSWVENDEPWTQHAFYYPWCSFILRNQRLGPQKTYTMLRRSNNRVLKSQTQSKNNDEW